MADSPEDQEKVERDERTRLMREESRLLSQAIDAERVRFDRILRTCGVLLMFVGGFLAAMAPLPSRGALVAGTALTVGPLVALVGGQGATRAENLPTWVRAAYIVGALVGAAMGVGVLR